MEGQARFDLEGPKIDIRVTRGAVTLPVAAVPNLLPGDVLWVHPDFPSTQSVHYLLIAAFLRGTTNPPPDDWFTRIDTWNKKVREEGVSITVPQDAQQAILFLAPETGGDFSTLRSAVRGTPGIFVRASQDLIEAGFEQARIEKYLDEIRKVPPGDPAALQEHSNLLARTLALKPNPDCFKRPVDQQYNCLTQSGTQTLLDDGHGQSVVAALSNGPGSDFINQASYTQIAGGGNFSAYIGAIVDLVRLTSSLHTAQYRYIPAITFPDADADANAPSETLNLRLNTPPSFHNPKSVIVIGLPSVQKATLPPLRPVQPYKISCLLDPNVALSIDGAPLVFSTSYAHDLVLHLNVPPGKNGASALDLPLTADAYHGGLVIDPNPSKRRVLPFDKTANAGPDDAMLTPVPGASAASPSTKPAGAPVVAPKQPGDPITGTIKGYWGFNAYTGPTLPLQNVPGQGWRIVTSPETPTVLIAGKPNHVQLQATGTACVESIALEPAGGKVDWKLSAPPKPPQTPLAVEMPPSSGPVVPKVEPVDVTLNLQHDSRTGQISLTIQQFGAKQPEQLGTKVFSEPAKIESLRIHAGDTDALLTGTTLDQVKTVTLSSDKHEFTYTPAASGDEADASGGLALQLPADTRSPSFKASDRVTAEVHLEDGRTLEAAATILPARPVVSLLSRRFTLPIPTPIQLASPDDIPLGAQLTFFLKSKEKFQRNEQIEIESAATGDAAGDPPLKTVLSIAAGSLVLEDNHTVLATLDPLKLFGPSTFGPFRMRAVAGDGTPGEWLPLANLVRLPELTDLKCPLPSTQSCLLSGTGLFLIDSVSTDDAFTTATPVPDGFVEPALAIPHPPVPAGAAKAMVPATFYLRLRDDPKPANTVTMPIEAENAVSAGARRGLPGLAGSSTPISAPRTGLVPAVAPTGAATPAAATPTPTTTTQAIPPSR